MYSLTIVFGASAPVLWTMLYKNEDTAKEAHNYVLEAKKKGSGLIGLLDDFSQEATIEVGNVYGFMLENLDQSQLGQIEKGLHDHRARVKLQSLIENDPAMRLRHSAMPVMQPMGNGFRPVS